MKLRKTKTAIFIILAVVFVSVVCVAVLKSLNGQSPYEYLQKHVSDASVSPSELLYSQTDAEGISIIFYRSQQGKYRCAVTEDRTFGHNILSLSGTPAANDTYLYSALKGSSDKTGICWGILTDKTVTDVFLNDEACTIGNTIYPGLRFFWILGNWSENELPTLTAK